MFFLRTKDKNEIYKIQLSGERDSLQSASSAFNGRCLRQKILKGKLPFSWSGKDRSSTNC